MLVTHIYRTLQALQECKRCDNTKWYANHNAKLDQIEAMYLPHGSGIDSGCKIDRTNTTKNQAVITFGWHRMDENGYYCGWYDFKIVVTPGFDSLHLRIVGRLHDIKDYLYDLFDRELSQGYDVDFLTDFNQ